MKEFLVSVRMPITLAKAIKSISQEEHYLDMSECIRSIIRKKTLEIADPYVKELKSIQDELQKKLATKADVQKTLKKRKVAEDLRKVLREVEGLQ